MKVKLTKQALTAAPYATAGHYVIRDAVLAGFYVKVGKTRKTFVFQRDQQEGGRRRTVHRTLGNFTGDERGVTCEAARQEAIRLLAEPARLAREGMTLQEAIALFDDAPAKGRKGRPKAAKTVGRYAQFVRSGYLASWMDRPLRSITRQEVYDRHRALPKEIAEGRYAGAKAGRSVPARQTGQTTADDVFRWFRAIWGRALRADETLPVCPTVNVEWFAVKRERTAIPSTSLAKWYEGVQAIPNQVRRDYLLFVLFTGLRRESAASVRWEHFDFKNKTLHIPKPKGGEERAFDLPLSDYLVALLKGRQRDNETMVRLQVIPADSLDWTFPAYSASGHVAEPRVDVPGVPYTIHDLRRTFATVAASLQLPLYVVGALLNHRQPGATTTEGYIAIETEQLRAPMQAITDRLRGLVNS